MVRSNRVCGGGRDGSHRFEWRQRLHGETETEERIAEVAVCCPGYKMRDVSCVPICPNGKTGPGCSEDCPDNKWGPNCIHECKRCKNGFCSPVTGECECLDGWQGESCDVSMPPTTATPSFEEILTAQTTKTIPTTARITSTVTTPRTTVTSPSTTTTTPSTIATTPSTISTTPTTVATTPTTISTTPPTVATPPTTVVIASITPVTTPMTTVAPTTKATLPTTASTKNLFTTTIDTLDTKEDHRNNMISTPTKETSKIPMDYVNTTLVATSTTKASNPTTEAVTEKVTVKPINNKNEVLESTTESIIVIKSAPTENAKPKPIEVLTTTEMATTLPSTTVETTVKMETPKKETTIKLLPTTVKFKPKEIWIRPAQKGESPIVETKIKTTHEFPRYRSANNNKEFTPTVTTPKTIIVSIIPTSVSYTTFKKIALTSSFVSTKNSSTVQSYNKTEIESTKPMLTETTTPPIKLSPLSRKDLLATSYFINNTLVSSTSVTPKPTTSSTKSTIIVTKSLETKSITRINRTNSMMTDINKNVSTSITTASFNATRTSLKINDSFTTSTTTSTSPKPTSATQSSTEHTTKHLIKYVLPKKVTATTDIKKIKSTTNTPKTDDSEFKKANVTKNFNKVTTEGPADDEEFHILTEPEHITAVMGDKGTERSSVDLISVISIAGGVMMAVITVAVVIVMIERCKKPRYEDVRKINDIRMQVMIDNNDVPPPYVRSIFHTPLPDPPSSEKCHYQPISTLDRNLKQFMRPVVVQTISPIMLENFRGILECHYDHLPRRSHEFNTIQARSSIAPSMNDCSELRQLRASVTESTIEALKCEAKLDVIDSTTSEPLYAEIPCWRPPSEHAIEIMNLNGEAVTEL
ncbi:hypothetical protein HF086_011509 [Spodoptera exigua]|uniref:EGF-like domain-containing protein n=1 Tax=Spodoptera exigua TaxID=7107 RepID=A0A922M4S8_SPOEX|nr:hypothetical protein HF086_011509 [Spodoptera exigua]